MKFKDFSRLALNSRPWHRNPEELTVSFSASMRLVGDRKGLGFG